MNWKHESTITGTAAIALLKQIQIVLSDPLNQPAGTVLPQVIQVWYEQDSILKTVANVSPPTTIFTIHGTTALAATGGPGLTWTCKDDSASLTAAFGAGGRLLVRVHCGFLFTTDGRNFSAALDCVTGIGTIKVPGGIFESWIFVKAG